MVSSRRRMKKNSQLTHVIPPPEVITEILYRLPAKSVGRFRCVSKGWLSLLTDPQFIKTHQNTLNQGHLIFESRTEYELYSHPFDHYEAVLAPTKFDLKLDYCRYEALVFLGSCDGLVLLSASSSNGENLLVVFNPTTLEFCKLPKYDYIDDEIDFDYMEINTMYGFGYDCVTNDYKVVSISYFHYTDDYVPDSNYVSVFSLRDKTWRRAIDSPFKFSSTFDLGVFVNGFVHWVAKKSFDGLPVIVAFSFADESFSEVSSPNLCNDNLCNDTNIMSKDILEIVDFDGKLVIYEGCEAWLMNEYGVKESWTKIPLDRLEEISLVEPMIFNDNGKIRVASNDRMLIYDVGKRTFSKTVYVWNPKTFKLVGTYIESLVSPIVSITN